MLQVGDKAPDFSLVDQTNHTVHLKDYRGKKAVVIFFYPKDDTPGCTAQSCSFRDNYTAFAKYNAQVIGISRDSPQSHQQFSQKHQLPFPLLTDEGGKVSAAFGVKKTLGILPGRVSFVVDQKGIIQCVFSSQMKTGEHVDRTLEVVKSLTE